MDLDSLEKSDFAKLKSHDNISTLLNTEENNEEDEEEDHNKRGKSRHRSVPKRQSLLRKQQPRIYLIEDKLPSQKLLQKLCQSQDSK